MRSSARAGLAMDPRGIQRKIGPPITAVRELVMAFLGGEAVIDVRRTEENGYQRRGETLQSFTVRLGAVLKLLCATKIEIVLEC